MREFINQPKTIFQCDIISAYSAMSFSLQILNIRIKNGTELESFFQFRAVLRL